MTIQIFYFQLRPIYKNGRQSVILIKKTSPDDFKNLLKLENECFLGESWSLSQISSHHETQNSILYLSENKTPIGYLIYLETPFELEILRIGVLATYRCQGIGKELLDFLDRIANKRDIFLEVHEENQSGIELYKKKGFIKITVRRRYYPDGKDAILMKRITNDR